MTDKLTPTERAYIEDLRKYPGIYAHVLEIIDRLAPAPAQATATIDTSKPDEWFYFDEIGDNAPATPPAPVITGEPVPYTAIEIATIRRRIDDEGLPVLYEY